MSKRQKNLGKIGENLAKKLLQNKGYKFIFQNFHCRFGEIDLIFQDRDTLVFVEVKTRWSDEFGLPEEGVSWKKIRKIIKTGEYFKVLHPQLPADLRIDVIAVEIDSLTFHLKEVRHLKNVTA